MTGTFVPMTLAHWMALYNDSVVMLQDPDEHQRRLISVAQLLRAHDEIDATTFVELLEKADQVYQRGIAAQLSRELDQ